MTITDKVSVGVAASLEVNSSKAAAEVTTKIDKQIINIFK